MTTTGQSAFGWALSAFNALPEWLRITAQRVVVSLVMALIASAVMHVGVYAYAYRHGARFPLEGVSFIAFLGGFFAFSLTLISLFLFQYLPHEVLGFRREALGGLADRRFTWKRRLKTNAAIVGLLFVAFSVIALVSFTGSYFLAEPGNRPEPVSFVVDNFALAFGLMTVVALLALNFNGADTKWQKVALWVFIAAAIGALLLVVGSTFRDFLRLIRYGGGLQIEVTLGDSTEFQSCLFLISDETVTFYDSAVPAFVEHPRQDVARLQYSPYGLVCDLPFPKDPKHKLETPAG